MTDNEVSTNNRRAINLIWRKILLTVEMATDSLSNKRAGEFINMADTINFDSILRGKTIKIDSFGEFETLNGKADFSLSAPLFLCFFRLGLTFGGLISYNLFFSTGKQNLVLCEGDKSQ